MNDKKLLAKKQPTANGGRTTSGYTISLAKTQVENISQLSANDNVKITYEKHKITIEKI